MKRDGIRRGIYILPNLLTTANLFCGFFSIVRSYRGDFENAAWMIGLALIFDALDGRVARFTKTQSDFGVEYDSLSDLTSFCLAPAILAYGWTLHFFGKLGWAAVFLFFVCGALRLARFNVQTGEEKKDFQGLPTPAAGGMVASYVVFHQYFFGPITDANYFVLGLVFGLAVLMVSSVPYASFKVITWTKKASFMALVLLAGFFALVATNPDVMLFVFACIYVAFGLLRGVIKIPQAVKSRLNKIGNYVTETEDESAEMDEEVSRVISMARYDRDNNRKPE